MKHLLHMHTDSCTLLALAVASKMQNVRLLLRASGALTKRYQNFDDIINNYKDRPAASRVKLLAPVLKKCYLSPPKDLDVELRARRREHNLDECPYCGYPQQPETLDHFLPKEHWPEYAIFSNNLVPQCRGCAPIKGQRYYCSTRGQALFIHPIYSSTLSTIIFIVEVSMVDDELIFKPKFSILEDVSDEDEMRIELHLKSLDVKKRIIAYCKQQYKRWIRLVNAKHCDIQASFKTRLNEAASDTYANNWRIAFYQGMLGNPEVVADIQRRTFCGPLQSPAKVRQLSMNG